MSRFRWSLARRQFLQLTAAGAAGVWLQRGFGQEGSAKAAKKLKVLTESPFNAEADPQDLATAWQTPLEHFYVRNHGPTPQIDPIEYGISVEGLVGKPRTFMLGEIKELATRQKTSCEATLTCAGNRRAEMSAIKKVGGVQWTLGAIGNAAWSGVPLQTLLKICEVKAEGKHVWFEGADPFKEKDGSESPFGGSIPLADGWETRGGLPGALVATEMNGRPLLAEHGFPARMLVPGFIGARSVKWLRRIIVSDKPSTNHFLAHAYKLVQTESLDEADAKEPIYQFPINAAICAPAAGAKVRSGKVTLQGFALPPGDGSTVNRVEVSLDGGASWKSAQLSEKSSPFCWRLWSLEATLAPGKHTLFARAVDSRERIQPEKCDWNAKGYLYNAWHRCEIEAA